MRKVIKIVFSISFIFYLFALVIILFLGSRGLHWSDVSILETIRYSSNFVPFRTINAYVTALIDGSLNMYIPLENLAGNVILFFPMGIYLPFFIKKLSNVKMFSISMATLIFVIEVLQLVTRRGSLDIDDFILNMVGALIGYSIWKTKFVQSKLQNRTTVSISN